VCNGTGTGRCLKSGESEEEEKIGKRGRVEDNFGGEKDNGLIHFDWQ